MKDLFSEYEDIFLKNTEVSAERIEELTMKKIHDKKVFPWKRAAAIAFAAALISATAFAAYSLLSPSEIAEKVGYDELAEVFEKDGTAFNIAPKEMGDYTVKLLGMTSGENLSGFTSDFNVIDERTYIVGSIERTDGGYLSDYPGMTLTPLVSGYKPWAVNIYTLNGGKSEFIYENKVNYFVYECDSLEVFADRTVYIALYEGQGAPSRDMFDLSLDGSIKFKDSVKGAMFEVPFDKSKADPEKARELARAVFENPEIVPEDLEETESPSMSYHRLVPAENDNGDGEPVLEIREEH